MPNILRPAVASSSRVICPMRWPCSSETLGNKHPVTKMNISTALLWKLQNPYRLDNVNTYIWVRERMNTDSMDSSWLPAPPPYIHCTPTTGYKEQSPSREANIVVAQLVKKFSMFINNWALKDKGVRTARIHITICEVCRRQMSAKN
jgi:hypothetical protein